MKKELTQEQAKAAVIVLIGVTAIVITAVFSKQIINLFKSLTGDTAAARAAAEAEAQRNKDLTKKAQDEADAAKKSNPTTRTEAYFLSAAKTIEDALSLDTAAALNRNEDVADKAFLSAINSNSDFKALVAAYGVRPYKTLFGRTTSASSDLLSLLKATLGTWRIDRMNGTLAAKKVTERI